jgi:glycosyltransferase involved in cell wall biosynthesis
MHTNQSPLTVVVLTKNEECSIERVLRSVPKIYKTLVFDSFSTDRTVELAKGAAAEVVQRVFDDYSTQRNQALQLVQSEWVLFLDADEVPDAAFWRSVAAALSQNSDLAYRIPRRMHFMGKNLRFGRTADSPVRLFKKAHGKYVGAIHESVITDHNTVKLGGEVLHYSYESLDDYFSKFNQYTTQIAARRVQEGRIVNMVAVLSRPVIEFSSRYVFRLGFLDGYAGFCFAALSTIYCFVKYAKVHETQKL